MKSNARDNNTSNKSSIGNKIIFKVFALTLIACVFIISNNAIKARNNDDKLVTVENFVISNNSVHGENKIIKLENLEYCISSVEHQRDENNPLLGKDSEYIIITLKVKNNGSKAEAFDAFGMILQTAVKGEIKNIRNISDVTIYNIPSGVQSDITLVYIVPNDSADIHIISEKSDKINFQIEY